MLDKLPTEILCEIGNYLDCKELTTLRFVSKEFNFIFGYIVRSRLLTYFRQCGIVIKDFYELTDVTICIFLNILRFVKNHIINKTVKMLTINITNTFFKRYYFRSNLCKGNILEKCIFLLSYDLFNNIQFNRLETIFSNLVIDEQNVIITSSINNIGNSKVVFMRTDYDTINEVVIDNNDDNNDDNDDDNDDGKKYMVTFHFFI
jgi:hypothetical protein